MNNKKKNKIFCLKYPVVECHKKMKMKSLGAMIVLGSILVPGFLLRLMVRMELQ